MIEAVATAAASLFLMMSFAGRYIETAGKIISAYDGSIPLHHFLKQFFAADKKYGSKDRKAIAHACYCYYRLGKAINDVSIAERIKAGIFLCNDEPGIWKTVFDEDVLQQWSINLQQRIASFQTKLNANDIFAYQDELSNEIDHQTFTLSHLVQPGLHLRLRPGKEKKVQEQLSAAGVQFAMCGEHCIALPNSSKVDQLLLFDKDVVVQDMSSQRVAELLSSINHPSTIHVWDCCAASGGKSILAYDTLKNIDLTVSDVRASIIQNLKKRFATAGIKNYRSFIADLSINRQSSTTNKYDLIICDAPCSGSGTWGRTPEQLSFFDKEKIEYYSVLQKKIASNVIPALAADGFLLYITCSVFKKENEEIVEYIKANTSLQLVRMEYLKGYDKKADTMFAALFTASAP
jgi:16S rRNA (cytosine967-C5)-methyltransferase